MKSSVMANALRIINAETAAIQTASVEIKSLMVSGKQMTLAVFRQMIDEDIIDRVNLKLNGSPWGHVRYLIDCDVDTGLHVIWQKGGELRRCIVLKTPTFLHKPLIFNEHDIKQNASWDKLGNHLNLSTWQSDRKLTITWNNIRSSNTELPCSGNKESYLRPAKPRDPDFDRKMEIWKKEQNDYEILEQEQNKKKDLLIAKYVNDCKDDVTEANKFIQKKLDDYDSLVLPFWTLPQLFIAV